MSEKRLQGIPVLVTGARGYIGSRLVQMLADEGATVNIIVRDSLGLENFKRLGCQIHQGDLTQLEKLAPAFEGVKLVFHTAVANGELKDIWELNVDGPRKVVEMAANAGAQRVVHVSTCAVHGTALPAIVHEDQPFVDQGDAYEVTKAQGEKAAHQSGKELGIEVTSVRPTLVYGFGSPMWVLNWFWRVKNNQCPLIDDGCGLANLVYIDDLVEGMILSAIEPGAAGEAFFINGPGPVTWKQYIGSFAKMLNKPIPPSVSLKQAKMEMLITDQIYRFTRFHQRLDISMVSLMNVHSLYDISKAREKINYNPKFDLEEGMKCTELWLRKAGYLAEQNWLKN